MSKQMRQLFQFALKTPEQTKKQGASSPKQSPFRQTPNQQQQRSTIMTGRDKQIFHGSFLSTFNCKDQTKFKEDGLQEIRNKLASKKKQIESMCNQITEQIVKTQQQQKQNYKQMLKQMKTCRQKRVDIVPPQDHHISHMNNCLTIGNHKNGCKSVSGSTVKSVQSKTYHTENQSHLMSIDNGSILKSKESAQFPQTVVSFQMLPSSIYYPPSCSAYDITYCKSTDTVHIYGGISCNTELNDGLKQFFFEYQCEQMTWKETKPISAYTPTPRYGHTLTAYSPVVHSGMGYLSSYPSINRENSSNLTNVASKPDSLLLFGGVSEYKEKLKDRCFYPDLWSYSLNKNNWKVLQFSGQMPKNRKSHTSAIYNNRYYIIYGGIDDSQSAINEINWVDLSERKGKWRLKQLKREEGRYNHQMTIIQTLQGRDYLAVFGGRNGQSEVIGNFLLYSIYIYQNELQFREPLSIKLSASMCPTPCEFPIMAALSNGIIIMGGIDANNEAANQCWYFNFNIDRMGFEKIKNQVDWSELRGAKAVTCNGGKSVYLFAGGNSKKYKAIKITLGSNNQEDIKFKL